MSDNDNVVSLFEAAQGFLNEQHPTKIRYRVTPTEVQTFVNDELVNTAPRTSSDPVVDINLAKARQEGE